MIISIMWSGASTVPAGPDLCLACRSAISFDDVFYSTAMACYFPGFAFVFLLVIVLSISEYIVYKTTNRKTSVLHRCE